MALGEAGAGEIPPALPHPLPEPPPLLSISSTAGTLPSLPDPDLPDVSSGNIKVEYYYLDLKSYLTMKIVFG